MSACDFTVTLEHTDRKRSEDIGGRDRHDSLWEFMDSANKFSMSDPSAMSMARSPSELQADTSAPWRMR